MARVAPTNSFNHHPFAVKVDSLGGTVSDVQEACPLVDDSACRQVKSWCPGNAKGGRPGVGRTPNDLGRYLKVIDAKLDSLTVQVSHLNLSMDNFSRRMDHVVRGTMKAPGFSSSTDSRECTIPQELVDGLRASGRGPQPMSFASAAEADRAPPPLAEIGAGMQDSVRMYRGFTTGSKGTASCSNASLPASAPFGLLDVLRDGMRKEARRRSSSNTSRRSSAATSFAHSPETPVTRFNMTSVEPPPPSPPPPRGPVAAPDGFVPGTETQHAAPHALDLPEGEASTHILHLFAQAKSRNVAVQKVWEVIDDPLSSGAATIFALCNQYFVLLTVFLVFMETIPNSPLGGTTAAVLQIVIDFIFVCEALLRFSVYPRRQAYFYNIHNVIDMLMVVPLGMRISISCISPEHAEETWGKDVLWCTVPLLRLLKVARHFESFRFLVKAFAISTEALPMLFYAMLLEVTLFSALIYWAEPRDNIHSLPHAVWLTLVTMTTVTYGDVVPKTSCGTVIVAALMICSLMLLGVPVGIMGNTFIEVWKNRDRDFLISRTRAALQKWGYTASDIPVLFNVVDGNANGEIDLSEFCHLVNIMKLGMPKERIIELFSQLDKDSNNSISPMEFVLALWPEAYIEASSRRPSIHKEESSYIRRISKHFSSMDALPGGY